MNNTASQNELTISCNEAVIEHDDVCGYREAHSASSGNTESYALAVHNYLEVMRSIYSCIPPVDVIKAYLDERYASFSEADRLALADVSPWEIPTIQEQLDQIRGRK